MMHKGLIAWLALALTACVMFSSPSAAASKEGDEAGSEAGADDHGGGEGGKGSKKDEKDPLTCSRAEAGAWTIEFDGYAFRAFSTTAEVKWSVETELDPVVTTGFFLELIRPRRTAGYYHEAEAKIWFNPPSVKLESAKGKVTHLFGDNLSHTYQRSIGFGSRQTWVDTEEFWYPHEDHFTVRVDKKSKSLVRGFEERLLLSGKDLRVELYAPMVSTELPIAYGDLVDTRGLAEAVIAAATNTRQLYSDMAECRMRPPNFDPPDGKKKDKAEGGGH